jgi:hypothetical protein
MSYLESFSPHSSPLLCHFCRPHQKIRTQKKGENDDSSMTSPSSSNNNNVLAHLSFEASDAAMMIGRGGERHLQGVLWKRRDVFKNRWRPRWFVLHPEQHILTYYLLSTTTSTSSSTTSEQQQEQHQEQHQSLSGNTDNRRRTFSESSNVSGNTVDYDVVPRGTLYLLGCTVEANEALTRSEEYLYALTIMDHENATHCHLAARTTNARERWIEQIRHVCRVSESSTPTPTPTRTRTVEEEDAYESSSSAAGPTSTNTNTNEKLWKTIPSPQLTHDLPSTLAAQIDQLLETHLPYVDDQHPEWKFQYNKDGIHCSSHIHKPMIRSIRRTTTRTHHHPVEYLQLLWDLPRLLEFETNVRSQTRLQTYNPHTCLVHTAYHRVWPTAARDFASAVHWRLLQNNNGERALCLLAFSCDEANRLQPALPQHVRGTLAISLNVWRLIEGGGGCVHTRIISYDLNGNIPKTLIQTILQQQATLPRIMDIHLQKSKMTNTQEHDSSATATTATATTATTTATTPALEMEYDSIYKALEHAAQATTPNTDGTMRMARTDSIVTSSSTTTTAIILPSCAPPPSVWNEIVVLLAPLVLYRFLSSFGLQLHPPVVFVITSILAVRWVFLQWLLQYVCLLPDRVQTTSNTSTSGTTCCRFTVDLKGVLRFLSNEQESRAEEAGQDDDDGAPELLVTHIVLRALARAMAQQPGLMARNGYYPVVLVPFYYYCMDICLHDNNHKTRWISHADKRSISEMAHHLQASPTRSQEFFGPSCRLWTTTPDYSDRGPVDLELSTATVDCPIAVVVSGIRLEAEQERNNKTTTHLSISITFQSSNDIEACRSFAEQVQRWIQFPEMCDN